MFTSFSGLSSRAKSTINPTFAPSVVYSPVHGCLVVQPGSTPQMPQFNYSNLTVGPFGLTTVQPDLELRLGLLGPTGTNKELSPKMVPKNERISRFSKECSLTLGHRTWAKTYRKRERPPRIQVQTDQSQLQPSQSREKQKKLRDYYGPCVRCGMTFHIPQTFASHMKVHYIQDETPEEKKERLAKKRRT